MKCEKCGSDVPEGNAFCTNCGAPVASPQKTFCTACGAEIPENSAFCTSCGTPVDGAVPVAATSASEPAPAQEPQPAPAQAPQPASAETPQAAPAQAAAPVAAAVPVQPMQTSQMPPVQQAYAQPAQQGGNGGTSKGLIIGIVVAAVVLVIAIVCIVVLVLPGSSGNDEAQQETQSTQVTYTVPNVVGKSLSVAQQELTNAGYSAKVEYADGEQDKVLSQSPSANTSLDKGSTVTITVGKGVNGTHEVELTVTNPRDNAPVSSMITLDANDEVIPDLETRRYTRAEIEAMNLSDAELYIARNSIVAHMGYIFQYQPNTEFFTKNCSWYRPTTHSYSLQGIPSENAETILAIEHARNSWYPEIK